MTDVRERSKHCAADLGARGGGGPGGDSIKFYTGRLYPEVQTQNGNPFHVTRAELHPFLIYLKDKPKQQNFLDR